MSSCELQSTPTASHPTKTLVLGSWGFFGVGHCGVLKKLQECGRLDSFSTLIGSGSGCIVLGLLACRIPIDDIAEVCMNLTKTVVPSILALCGGSLLDREKMLSLLSQLILSRAHRIPTLKQLYEETKILLVFTAYSLTDRHPVNIRHTSHPNMTIIEAITAATAIPLIYPTFHYADKAYADSSLSNPYPTDIVKNGEGIAVGFTLPPGSVPNDNMSYFANYLLSPIGSLHGKNQHTKRYDHIIVPVDSIVGSVKDYQKAYTHVSELLNANCLRDH